MLQLAPLVELNLNKHSVEQSELKNTHEHGASFSFADQG